MNRRTFFGGLIATVGAIVLKPFAIAKAEPKYKQSIFNTDLYKFWKKELECKKFKYKNGEVQAMFEYNGPAVGFYTNVLSEKNLLPERVAELTQPWKNTWYNLPEWMGRKYYAMKDIDEPKAIRYIWRA